MCDFQVNELDCAGCEVVLDEKMLNGKVGSEGKSNLSASTAMADEEYYDNFDNKDKYDADSVGLWVVRFTLRKERMDTLGAIAMLSRQLCVPVRSFGFAGLKDHRAVTTQEMTVSGVEPAALRVAEHHAFTIGNIRTVERPLKLGQLGGNRFRLRLRGVHGGRGEITAALSALKAHGFVNYFGLQRFGDCGTRNDDVGRCLLLGTYAAAVEVLLGPSESSEHQQEPGWGGQMARARKRRLAECDGLAEPAASNTASTGTGGAGTTGVTVGAEIRPQRSRCVAAGRSGAEAEARAAWLHSNDARTALKLMPRCRALEREVLSNLAHLASTVRRRLGWC